MAAFGLLPPKREGASPSHTLRVLTGGVLSNTVVGIAHGITGNGNPYPFGMLEVTGVPFPAAIDQSGPPQIPNKLPDLPWDDQ